MNYSLTYVGIIACVLGYIFKAASVDVGVEDINVAINVVLQLGGALVALYGRFRRGDITVAGVKKTTVGSSS